MESITLFALILSEVATFSYAQAEVNNPVAYSINEREVSSTPIQIKGVFPKITVMTDGVGSRSEAGIGALIPWANKLWAIGYVSHIKGKGLGLYEISDDMTMQRHPASVTGTFANRMVHWESNQVFIGPYAIDSKGNVHMIEALKNLRLTATMQHLTDPANKVYFLTNGAWKTYKTIEVPANGKEI